MASDAASAVSYTRLAEDEDEDENVGNNVKGSINANDGNYSDAVDAAGFGRFHALMLIACGWANMSDSVEILSVSFLLPQASVDMDINSFQKGLLTSIIFFGLLVGSYFWGALADVQGRRQILIYSLACNAIFGLLSSVSQSFWLFITMRFFSGVGVGGSIPVIFSYFGEFQPSKHRGAMISGLSTFWMCGNILTAALAWAVIPREYLGYHSPNGFSYESWRIFIALCCVPAASSVLTFLFLPESPKYLLERGETEKALDVMKKIYCWNHRDANPEDYPIKHLIPSTKEDESKYLQGSTRNNNNNNMSLSDKAKTVLRSTAGLFRRPLRRITIPMLAIFFCLSYGYYGLSMWFPELFLRVESTGSTCSETVLNVTSNATDANIYIDGFYTAIASLPGNILTIVLMDRIGRKFLLTTSLILSGVSVFFIWFLKTRIHVLIMSILFGGISVISWNTLNVVGVELYPTSCRATALGLQSVVNRSGAILGNLMFGLLIELHCAVPMFLIATLLAIGGVAALTLPNTTKIALK